MSSSNCFFLICKQISHEAGQVVWYSHLLEEFSSLLWSIQSKAMATHSSTPAWKIPWTGEPGGLQFMGSLRVRHDWAGLHFHFSLSSIGEGNGDPLQCSCLENPRDGGARWAAVYGVAQSQTQLKWLKQQQWHLTCFSIPIFPVKLSPSPFK